MRKHLLIFAGIVGLGLGNVAMSQDFDDIYFDSSSSHKKEKKQERRPQYMEDEVATNDVFTGENYIAERDVDEYNRRGSYAAEPADSMSLAADSSYADGGDTFRYTERIKRFHNPTVVIESSDPELVDLYVYTRPSVNIVVGTPTYAPLSVSGYFYTPTWSYYDPWSPYRYAGWVYDPFYFTFYDPFYHYGYGYTYWHQPFFHHHHHYAWWYDPVPHWGHGCAPSYGWHGGNVAHRPGRYGVGSGNSRRPTGVSVASSGNSRRPGSSVSRIGNIVSRQPASQVGNRQPVSGSKAGIGGTVRSKSGGSGYRNSSSASGGVYRRPSSTPSSSQSRPSAVDRGSSSRQRDSYNNSYNNSYNSGRSSSGSFGIGGGSRSSGSSGGMRGGSGRRR